MLLIKPRVLSFIPASLLCSYIFTATYVEGYASWCENNQTIFVREESTAKFQANFTGFDWISRFTKTAPEHQYIFYIYRPRNSFTNDDLGWYDRSWENRTHISVHENPDNQNVIQIEVSNISMGDNGTYNLRMHEDNCLTLFVLQMRQRPKGAVEENKPVYVHAHPHASLITRPISNATMVWLLDGLSINQTASFIQQDGLIWIPHIQRGMDGRNVTYRAIQDNGNVNEVNYTFNVMYGPSRPLTLVPDQTQYHLKSGDIMPDITCTTDCKPLCSISWGKYSNGTTLSLGAVTSNDTGQYTCTAIRTSVRTVEQTVSIHVADEKAWLIHISPPKMVYIMYVGDTMPEISCTADCNPPCNVSWGNHSTSGQLKLGSASKEMNGEYMCTATRKGSSRRVEKSITIYVQDNTSLTIAVACLATIQVLTLLGIGLWTYFIYSRTKQSPCQTCFSTIAKQSSNINTADDSNSPAANDRLEHYEDLDIDARHTNTVYGEVNLSMTALPVETGFQVYENTEVSTRETHT